MDGKVEAVEEVGLEPDAYSLFLVRLLEVWDTKSVEVEIVEQEDRGRNVLRKSQAALPGYKKDEEEKNYCFTVLNFSHACFLYVLAVVLQLCVTVILLQNAERLESSWESATFEKKYGTTMGEAAHLLHQAVDTNTSMLNTTESTHAGLVERCTEQLQVRYYFFYYIMIFIWIATMLTEFDSASSLIRDLYYVDEPPEGHDISAFGYIREKSGNLRQRIVAMTKCQKAVLIFCVPCIRICVACAITYSGCKFLMLQVSEMRIVLKALCMKFVITIDDLFLLGFSTKAARDRLKELKIKTHRMVMPHMRVWDNAGGGFFHIITAFIGLGIVWFIFKDLMLFRKACAAYHVKFGEFKDLGTQRRLASAAQDL